MSINNKIKEMFSQERDHEEVSRWIFSLTPLGVAFTFYFIFLWPLEIEHKNLLYVIGAAAGFSGLQAYWIVRGWRRNEGLTVVLGIIGIAFALLLAWLYLGFSTKTGG